MAERPLRPAKDQWLGRLLPFQLPNPPRAHLKAEISLITGILSQTLRQILTCYSPVRHEYQFIQLACVKPIARVHSGPGSNPFILFYCTKISEKILLQILN